MIRHFCDFCGNGYDHKSSKEHFVVEKTLDYGIPLDKKYELCDICYDKVMRLKALGR